MITTLSLHMSSCIQVQAALDLWDSSAPGASFVFTSSMSVCAVNAGSLVTEDSPLVAPGAAASTDKLLAAEKLVLQVTSRYAHAAP